MNDEDSKEQFRERISFTEDDVEFIEPAESDDAGRNLVELVELLQEIDEKHDTKDVDENAFVVYDKDGNKVIL
jgi:hypothetical protein